MHHLEIIQLLKKLHHLEIIQLKKLHHLEKLQLLKCLAPFLNSTNI